jgi:hypothetical protein
MTWDPARVTGPLLWPSLFGYHLNVARENVPDAAMVAAINPTSPNVVFAGDQGVAERLPQMDVDGIKTGSIPNPNYSTLVDGTPAHPFATVFLLFADEAEARALLPDLWIEPATFPALHPIGAP